MTIILDESLPHGLCHILEPHQVTTVQKAGYAGMKNGALLAAIEGVFDIFITADKNIRYQQNLAGRQISIIELPTNRWPLLLLLQPKIIATVDRCKPSTYEVVSAAYSTQIPQ